jgi:hypothetical protein
MTGVTPAQVLDLLGIDYIDRPGRLMFCCPHHHDTDPSVGFYEDTELAYCFACGYTLDPIGFYAAYNHGLDNVWKNYRQSRFDLEKRFGEYKPRRLTESELATLQTRRRAMERHLINARHQLPMQVFAACGEVLDRIILLRERQKIPLDAGLDNDMQMWLLGLREAENGNYQLVDDGPPIIGPHARLKEGLADVSGSGRSDSEIDMD